MIRKFALLPIVLFLAAAPEQKPQLPENDRIRIAEAFRIGDTLGTRIWKNWDQAPFAVLLVTPKFEYLVRHPNPTTDFSLLRYDPLLKSNVLIRKRSQRIDFLATFPAVDAVPTIVIGQPENTGKTSSSWVLTMLHEHFHQLQYSRPDYYLKVDALNLSGGDQTGMWMLQYPFPYDSTEVQRSVAHLAQMLHQNLASGKPVVNKEIEAYLRERQKFQKLLSEADYKYLSFQLWQEGIARYTECKIGELVAAEYQPTLQFKKLKDYTPFATVAKELHEKVLDQLQNLDLKRDRRSTFYPFGAGEGFLLDQVNPGWHDRYFDEKFFLEKYFAKK